MSTRLFRRAALSVTILAALAAAAWACSIPPFSTASSSGWPSCQTVLVNIDSAFTTQEYNAIVTAFQSWQNTINFGSGPIIQFAGFTQSSSVVAAPGFHTGPNVYQVTKAVPPLNPSDDAETGPATTGLVRGWAFTIINPAITNTLFLTQAMAHEIGHTFALLDCLSCPNQSSIMVAFAPINITTTLPNGPTGCDQAAANAANGYFPGECTPAPTPTPDPGPPQCDPDDGAGFTRGSGGGGTNCSPIIIDTDGEGFHLTSALGGVIFDIRGDGNAVPIAWTAIGSRNAFLVLDRTGNGIVDNGTELFGNFTPQPPIEHPNGFAALAVYDLPQNGGNGDGIIDSRDQVFASLRLWIDENHDGKCQPEELHKLPELGVFAISLEYTLSKKTDQFGNVFRYRARVNPTTQGDLSEAGKWAYDVFLR